VESKRKANYTRRKKKALLLYRSPGRESLSHLPEEEAFYRGGGKDVLLSEKPGRLEKTFLSCTKKKRRREFPFFAKEKVALNDATRERKRDESGRNPLLSHETGKEKSEESALPQRGEGSSQKRSATSTKEKKRGITESSASKESETLSVMPFAKKARRRREDRKKECDLLEKEREKDVPIRVASKR